MSEQHFPFLGWSFLVRGDYVEARWPDRKAVTTWPKRPGKNGSGFYDLCKQIFQEQPVTLSREEARTLVLFYENVLCDTPCDHETLAVIEKLRETVA